MSLLGKELDQDPALSLTSFLRSSAIMHPQTYLSNDTQTSVPQPHEILAALINDERWTRRMLEDWFKQGSMRERGGSVTPDPELRAMYLVILDRILKREKDVLAEEKTVRAKGEEKNARVTARLEGEGQEERKMDVDKDGFEKVEWLK